MDCPAVFVKTARNDGKETLVFKGFFCCERQLLAFKSRLSKSAFCFVDSSPCFRKAQNDKKASNTK